jgi:hypothetical protein
MTHSRAASRLWLNLACSPPPCLGATQRRRLDMGPGLQCGLRVIPPVALLYAGAARYANLREGVRHRLVARLSEIRSNVLLR